ncbi:hypothetical protein C5746_21595 [Streptomyces atratus]|uniref:Uncharacterized protein n=1 Tax=Streptomyces atratus TaxID=1893 RepID=A0A2Z5JFR9_STRAR|nr:hypothetical protein C5746_21595 [Streptomyces atratus]
MTVRCSAAGTDGVAAAIDGAPAPLDVQRTGTASARDTGSAPGTDIGPAPAGEDGTTPSTAERCTAPGPPLRPFWSVTGRSASSGATGAVFGGGTNGACGGTAGVRCTAGVGLPCGVESDAAGSKGESPSSGAVGPPESGSDAGATGS